MNKNSYDAVYNAALKSLRDFETSVMDDSYISESINYDSATIYLKARYTLFSSTYAILLSEYGKLIERADNEVDKLLNIIGKDNMTKVKVDTISKINTLEDTLYILHRSTLDLQKVTMSVLVAYDAKKYVPTLIPHKPESLDKIRTKLLGKTTSMTINNLGEFKKYIGHLSRTFHIIKDIKLQYKYILDEIQKGIDSVSKPYDMDYKILIDRTTQYFSKNIDIIIRISIDIINIIITILRNIVDSINKHRINEI